MAVTDYNAIEIAMLHYLQLTGNVWITQSHSGALDCVVPDDSCAWTELYLARLPTRIDFLWMACTRT